MTNMIKKKSTNMTKRYSEELEKMMEDEKEGEGYTIVNMSPLKESTVDAEITSLLPQKDSRPERRGSFDGGRRTAEEGKAQEFAQSVIVSEKDMKFMVRDTETGMYYDMREEDSVSFLNEEEAKLTKIEGPKQKHWKEWWEKKRNNNYDLLASSEKGDVEKVKELLDPKKYGDLVGEVNAKGLDDFTPLHFCSSEGHYEVAELLLQKGAIVDSLSSSNRTPLHVACIRGFTKLIQLFVEYGSNISAQDSEDNTPGHILAENGWQEALEFLLTKKPDLSLKNKYGETVLDISANISIRTTIQKYVKDTKINSYSRTVVENVLLHNNRADYVKSMLFRAQMMSGEAPPAPPTPPSDSPKRVIPNMTKRKRIKIVETMKRLSMLEVDDQPREKPSHSRKTEDINVEDIIGFIINIFVKKGLESFDIHQLLGKGSFGEVYLVRYRKTGKLYAMKAQNKKRIMGSNLLKYAQTERNVLCFTKHPFIVGIDFAFQTSDKLFLILEYCPGGDLSHLLIKETRITEDKARIYAAEVLLALEDLHKRDIIFRDLKPDNVVFDEDGHALLTDFGLSKEAMMDSVMTKSFCGSVAYLAPEMIKKTGHGKAVDWYLLGVLIYEMLVGIPPYFSNNKDKLFRNIERAPLKLPMYLSQEVCNLVVALLNRDPRKRLGAKGSSEIKAHPWFKTIDWAVALERGLKPPKPPAKPEPKGILGYDVVGSTSTAGNHLPGWGFISKHVIYCKALTKCV